MKNLKCNIFGHLISQVSLDLKEAKCKRCGEKLKVVLDYKSAKFIVWKVK